MQRRMHQVFPQLADVPLEQVWGGYVDITRNRAPHWGRLDGNLYFAQGFSGHGVAAAGLAGEVIAAAIAGQSERTDVFQRLRHAPSRRPAAAHATAGGGDVVVQAAGCVVVAGPFPAT